MILIEKIKSNLRFYFFNGYHFLTQILIHEITKSNDVFMHIDIKRRNSTMNMKEIATLFGVEEKDKSIKNKTKAVEPNLSVNC